jgi:hypothetical protein
MELFDFRSPLFSAILFVIIVWDVVWKGFALWKSARNNHLVWFICIIFFNTVGILPIVYILLNRSKKE